MTTREVTGKTNQQPTADSNSRGHSNEDLAPESEGGREIKSEREVVGIDPGTTTAVVALDIEGQIIAANSERHMAFEDISRLLIEQGKPVVVAADKGKIPGLVEKTAATFGALAYSPKEDLGQEEKKSLVSDFDGDFDSHTEDALAAAYHAWSNYHNLFRRVKKRVKEESIDDKFDDVLVQVIKQSKPIKEAVKDVKRGQKETESQQEVKDGQEKQRSKQWWRNRAQKLSLQLDGAENKIENLEEYNQQLAEDKEALEKELDNFKSRKEEQRQQIIKEEEVKRRTELVRRKSKEIDRLQRKLEQKTEKIKVLKWIIDKLKQGWLPVQVISSRQQLANASARVILLETQLIARDVEEVNISKQVQIALLASGKDKSEDLVSQLEDEGLKVVNEDSVAALRQNEICAVDPQTLESEEKEFFSWIKQYKQDRAQAS